MAMPVVAVTAAPVVTAATMGVTEHMEPPVLQVVLAQKVLTERYSGKIGYHILWEMLPEGSISFCRLFQNTFYLNRCDTMYVATRGTYRFERVIVNLAHQSNTVEGDVFVGLVNGRFFAAKFGTEAATAF